MNQAHEREAISLKVLRELLLYRRRLASPHELLLVEEAQLISIHLPRVIAFVEARRQIEFVIAAFPCKSPNLNKVLGTAPDMAERLSLIFLNALCQRIQLYYPPGARITICSDGRVFSDLVGVTDAVVDVYQLEIRNLIYELGVTQLELFNLEDVEAFARHKTDYAQLRQLLLTNHAESEDVIKQRLTKNESGLQFYRAISRFLYEDGLTPEYQGSHAELQRNAKHRAVGVIQRSWAWGHLLEQNFPGAIRLSIHPQPANSPKIGLHLMPSNDDWLTPWHGVAANIHGKFVLTKRKEALEMGGELVYIRGVPSHYLITSEQHAGTNPDSLAHGSCEAAGNALTDENFIALPQGSLPDALPTPSTAQQPMNQP